MVYILEFDKPLGNPNNPRGQARYYVGSCEDHRYRERMEEHESGRGAAITRAAAAQGIGWKTAFILPGCREVEKAIKRRKNTPRFVASLRRRHGSNVDVREAQQCP